MAVQVTPFSSIGNINPALKRQPVAVGAGNLIGFGPHYAPGEIHVRRAAGDIEREPEVHALLGPGGDLVERVDNLHGGLAGNDSNLARQ